VKTDRFRSHPIKVMPVKNLYYLLILIFFVGCNQPQANGENKTAAQKNAVTVNGQGNTTNNTADAITVVNWNIEWLGSASHGPKDKEQQLSNTKKILAYLKAGLYCLCEIVDPNALKQLATSLGSRYAYTLSGYASGAASSADPGYDNAQKLAYIYNKDVFKNIHASGYLQHNPKAGYYFAAGRYPFELQATIHTESRDQSVDFLIIHAKSGADRSSYNRRLQGALNLKAALDKDKAGRAFMLLGDFNDHVTGSITNGKGSPYACFVQDPAYHVLTGELKDARSTLDYPGVIDHQIVSEQLYKYYKAGSAKIRTDITQVVPEFNKGQTSDHYPVSSMFVFSSTTAEAPAPEVRGSVAEATDESADAPQRLQQRIFTANVSTGNIMVHATAKTRNIQFILYNKKQHKVLSVHRKYILKGDSFRIRTPSLYKGDYTLVILSDHGKQVLPFSVN